jgi:hypothetical protein
MERRYGICYMFPSHLILLLSAPLRAPTIIGMSSISNYSFPVHRSVPVEYIFDYILDCVGADYGQKKYDPPPLKKP